jgi:hypothetical protein
MCKSFSATWLFALLIGVFMGCRSTDKNEAAKSTPPTAANVETKAGVQHQYRAVCIEKEAHGGNEAVLSRWLDSKDKAVALGETHAEDNVHRWRLEERVKPEKAEQ